MAVQIKRTQLEIDEVVNAASEAVDAGSTSWPGMTYEDGVVNALAWVLGESDDNPMTDE